MKDRQGFELLNQSAVSIEYQQIQYIVSTQLALMIAVVIFPILSTVFLAMYFTTEGNACRRQNNKGNESKNCTVKCSANQTKSHNSGTG